MLLPTGCVLLKTIGAKTSPWRAKDRFFVPTLRVQVLGKDQREHEMKREGETRTGLGSGVWSLVRAEERKHETRKLGQTSGARQSPFSREGDLGFLTSILLTLTSDPPRERSELSIFLITLHAPLSTALKRTLDNALSPLLPRALPTTCNAQPTTVLAVREAEMARVNRLAVFFCIAQLCVSILLLMRRFCCERIQS